MLNFILDQGSLPARGGWIEICISALYAVGLRSLPARGGGIEITVNRAIAPINPSWNKSGGEAFFQFIRFAMVGVTNVLASYTINITTLLILKRAMPDFHFGYIITIQARLS